MALDLGELSARITVDDSHLGPGLASARRRFAALGGDLNRQGRQMGSQAGEQLGSGFTASAHRGLSRLNLGGAVAMFGRMAGMGTAALGAVGVAGLGVGIKVAAGMENARIAFTTMLGSAEKADSFLRELQRFAATTPFEFPELQTAASSLISAGIEADKVIPIMTSLGNATSGMGTGSEGVKRATIALQQMSAAGRITGEDLNQLRDAGIPVFDLLAEATGRSKKEVAALAQQGKLTGDDLQKMMDALAEGRGLERFNGLMQQQSQSLAGMWSTVKDTLGQGLANAITPVIPLLKEGLGGAAAFAQRVLGQLPDVLGGILGAAQRFSETPAWAGIRSAVGGAFSAIGEGAKGIPGIIDTISGALNRFAGSETWAAIQEAAGGLWKALRGLWEFTSTYLLPGIGYMIEQWASARDALMPVVAAVGGMVLAFKAWRLAVVAYTAVQAALNVIMAANPWALAALALAGLVAGMIYAYKHSERFRAVVDAVFSWFRDSVPRYVREGAQGVKDGWASITGAFSRAWRWVSGFFARNWLTILGILTGPVGFAVVKIIQHREAIQGALNRLRAWAVGAFKRAWAAVERVVVQPLSDARAAVARLLDRLGDRMTQLRVWARGAFRRAWAPVQAVLTDPVGSARTAIARLVDRVQERFNQVRAWARGTFRRAWAAIKDVLTDPVGAARDAINRILGGDDTTGLRGKMAGFIRAAKRILDGIKAAFKDPIVTTVGIINTGLIGAFNWVVDKMKLPADLRVANINLPGKGWHDGGYTGKRDPREPVGVVHGDEQVIRSSSRRQIEAKHPGLMDYMNMHGALPRLAEFFLGGRAPVPGSGNRHTGGYPWARWAGDFPNPQGTPVRSWADGIVALVKHLRTSYGSHVRVNHRSGLGQTLYAHLSRVAVRPGQQVDAGQILGNVGSTGNSTGPHLHFELAGRLAAMVGRIVGAAGQAAGAVAQTAQGAWSWLGKHTSVGGFIRDRINGALGALAPGGWGRVVGSVPRRAVGAIVDRVQGLADSALDKINAAAGEVGGNIKALLGKGTARVLGLTSPATRNIANAIGPRFGFKVIGTYPGHQPTQRKALDFMTSSMAQGDAAAAFAKANARTLGIQYLIWNRRIWNIERNGEGWRRYFDGGSSNPSRAHTNHIHVSAYANGTRYAARGFGWSAENAAELVVNPRLNRYTGGERVLNPQQTRRAMAAVDGSGASDRPYIGSLTLVSSGDTRKDLAEVGWKVRTMARGGVHAGR